MTRANPFPPDRVSLRSGTKARGQQFPAALGTSRTEDAGIEDLRVRTRRREWALDVPPVPNARWGVRVRRAERAPTEIVRTETFSDEVAVEACKHCLHRRQ
ncbi:hypothetical protein M2162_000266 [Streptomyces sp. SAI-041]|nr:hypothetical protein [Streptomyces sp. SAI-041]